MIKFKEFYSESVNDEMVDRYRQVITSEPFNFTWLYPDNMPEFQPGRRTTVANRKNTCDSLDEKSKFFLTVGAEGKCYISYPFASLDFANNPDTDLNNINMFFLTSTLCDSIEVLQDFVPKHWVNYNYYMSLSGTKGYKNTKLIEFMFNHKKGNIDNPRIVHILHRNKLMYYPKDQISKRDYIRGALTDL